MPDDTTKEKRDDETLDTSEAPSSNESTTIPVQTDENIELEQKLARLEGMEPSMNQNDSSKEEEQKIPEPTPVEEATPAPVVVTEDTADEERRRKMEAAIAHNKETPKAKKPWLWMVLSLLLILCLAAASAYIFYEKDNQAQQINSINAKATSAEMAKTAAEKKLEEANKKLSAQTQISSEEFRTIPEWGVKYKVTDTNKEVMHGIFNIGGASRESIGFFSIDLARKLNSPQQGETITCGVGSAGLINRYSEDEYQKQIKAAQPSGITATAPNKKIGEYRYVYVSPQGTCSTQLTDQQIKASDAVKGIVPLLEASQS